MPPNANTAKKCVCQCFVFWRHPSWLPPLLTLLLPLGIEKGSSIMKNLYKNTSLQCFMFWRHPPWLPPPLTLLSPLGIENKKLHEELIQEHMSSVLRVLATSFLASTTVAHTLSPSFLFLSSFFPMLYQLN